MNSLYKALLLLPASIKFFLLRSVIISFFAALADFVTLVLISPVIQSYGNQVASADSSNVLTIDLPFPLHNISVSPLIFALIFVSLVSISSLLKSATLYACLKSGAKIGTFFSAKLYQKILYIPYEKFLQISSSSITNLLTNVTAQCALAANYFLQLITSISISFMILVSMFIVDFNASAFLLTALSFAYLMTAIILQPKFVSNNKNVVLRNDLQLQSVNDTLGGIKQIALSNYKSQWLTDYRRLDREMRVFQLFNVFYSALPRFIIESFAIIILILIGFLTYYYSSSVSKSVSVVVTFTVALQKLLPVSQNIFAGWSGIKSSSVSLGLMVKSLSEFSEYTSEAVTRHPIEFESLYDESKRISSLSLLDVSYKYPSRPNLSLVGASLRIEAGELIGLVGESGSGKTTLMDLMCSLVQPTYGEISLKLGDKDFNLQSVKEYYREHIALVSQEFHVSNDSIASNIAFDKPIDDEKLIFCAQYACILSFVESLPEGFSFIVGDNGKSLSGGQKQRLAIARALYQSPSILFLDEATSALDVETQKDLINNLKEFASITQSTVVMIAHRFESLQFCDRIIHLKNGRIANDNLTFHQLMQPTFKL